MDEKSQIQALERSQPVLPMVPGVPDLQVHPILDDYATHKTPDIKKWPLAHPRFHLYFTPTCRRISDSDH